MSISTLLLPIHFGNYVIRSVTLEDIERVYLMRKAVATESETVLSSPDEITLDGMSNWIKNWLGLEKRLFLVAEFNNELIGQLWVWFMDGKKKTSHVAEFGLEILSNYRGAGLGTKLTEIAILWAKEKGAIRLEAETLEKNLPMRKILLKLGFEEEGKKKWALRIGDLFENSIIYGKILNN
ncbi:N-acetyltransferase family protein [Fervidobacterium sp.]